VNQILFQKACDKIINIEREKNGIGTLSEKTIHAVLKYYFEPDDSKHEVKNGIFVADIFSERGIIEIQTRNFNLLRKKLKTFLELGSVTVAYPIPYIKWLKWIDESTGEVTNLRKSPKKGTPYMALFEFYKIKEFLTHPNLKFSILLINMEEYRLLNGWSKDKKKGSTRFDRIPLELVEEISIQSMKDYDQLIPDTLQEGFTSKDYKKSTGLSLASAQRGLNVLSYVGAVKRIGKNGNSYIYERAQVSHN
jgi:hypothetical protein